MRAATAVIGANYGDEGKGLIVDYFTSKLTDTKIVVRANGGAQAGHTVVTPTGDRHIFSHFSAGTFAGASTYLAKHFVCNPIFFWVEYKKLKELGHLPPTVAIDPRCLITTPFDMMVNQVLEDSRGNARHGSVGIGFGETIGRNIFPAFQLWRSDLASNRTNLAQKLRLIRDNWLPIRLKQLDLPRIPRDDERLSDKVIDFFLEELIAFHDATMIAGAEFLTGKSVIFEGAQGLLLDMDKGKKPHVTRSNTGLKNVVPIAKAARLNLSVVYVTRSYMTRHGAGPLDGEYSPDPPIIDETNSEHPYQGKLRFGRLDTTALLKRVHEDANEAQKVLGVNIPRSIAVSCIDQIDDKTTERNIQTNLKPRFVSFGKTRDHIIRIEGGL